MIVALAGGVGAARFLRGLMRVVPATDITVVVNTGDDEQFHGLHVSPDIDTVIYTLSGAVNPDTGWGLDGDSFRCMDALDRYGDATWFRLGDLDLATHLHRTHRLRAGATLSEVTAGLARAWDLALDLRPMSDDPAPTRLWIEGSDQPMPMQEWFVHHLAEPPVTAVDLTAAQHATPAPGVLEALERADAIVVCPSNPLISIGPILAVPGIRDVLRRRRDRVVAVSPIIGGATVKGPADRLMRWLGVEVSCAGVASLYQDLCAALVIDEVDAGAAAAVETFGVRAVVTPTLMRDLATAATLAESALAAVAA